MADPTRDALVMACAFLSLAHSAGMPDSFFATDSRVRKAKAIIKRYGPTPADAALARAAQVKPSKRQYCLGSRIDGERSRLIPSQVYCSVCERVFTIETGEILPTHMPSVRAKRTGVFREK